MHQANGADLPEMLLPLCFLVKVPWQEPDLLIAEEPTTALDATHEVQVIHLLKGLILALAPQRVRSTASSAARRLAERRWRPSR